MTDLHDLLLHRHSIRRYTAEPVSPEEVKTIIEAGLLSPSSKSLRPWQFIIVEDKEKLRHLSGCKPAGALPLRNAAFAIVVCADPAKSDCWIEDASVAMTMMHLQAAALGLGSCWVQIRGRYSADEEPAEVMIQQALDIPATLPVVAILTVGHPDENRKPVDPEKLLWEKVHIESYKGE